MNFSLRLLALIVFVPSCFICCAQKKQTDTILLFNKDNFFADTLLIKARFMECGEFGGHLEECKVYLKKEELFLTYQKFEADCNTIKDNNGEPLQTLKQTVNKKLSTQDKELIGQYMHGLLDAKFTNAANFHHAGYIFEIKKNDGTVDISLYSFAGKELERYLGFIKRLTQ